MIIIAIVSFLFGLFSKARMSLPPFAALNVALLATLSLAGAATGIAAGAIGLDVIVGLAAAQAGYVAGIALELRRSHPARAVPLTAVDSTGSTASGIDRTP